MRRKLRSAVLCLPLLFSFVIPVFASRHKDFPNSDNGSSTPNACPADSATPFLAALNGIVSPSTGSSSGNCASAPSLTSGVYPDLSVSLSSTQLGVTVKIEPALFASGLSSAKTVLHVSLSAPANWTLKSVILGSVQSNPEYVICDPAAVGGASSKAPEQR